MLMKATHEAAEYRRTGLNWPIIAIAFFTFVVWFFAIVGALHVVDALSGVVPFLEACR